jgi:hypothetical protein
MASGRRTCGVFRAGELAADLGRDEELVARLGTQEPAESVFGKSASIPGRGVVVAHTHVPCGLHRGVGIGLGHLAVKLAQMGGTQAEGWRAETRRADPFRARNSIRQRSLPERTIANLPVSLSLGITAAKKIADMCEANDVLVIPHAGQMHNYHVSSYAGPISEYFPKVPVEVFWYIFDGGPVAKNGFVDLSDTAPGFGLTLKPVDANFKLAPDAELPDH